MNTATTKFIEDAVKGGWKFRKGYSLQSMEFSQEWPNEIVFVQSEDLGDYFYGASIVFASEHEILLDPLAWQAVGKVRGWEEGKHIDPTYHKATPGMYMWHHKMHMLVHHLADGKSIEEALVAIE